MLWQMPAGPGAVVVDALDGERPVARGAEPTGRPRVIVSTVPAMSTCSATLHHLLDRDLAGPDGRARRLVFASGARRCRRAEEERGVGCRAGPAATTTGAGRLLSPRGVRRLMMAYLHSWLGRDRERCLA